MFMGLGNGYALYEVTSDGVDTVGVWGSNPHAPTIFFRRGTLRTCLSRTANRSSGFLISKNIFALLVPFIVFLRVS